MYAGSQTNAPLTPPTTPQADQLGIKRNHIKTGKQIILAAKIGLHGTLFVSNLIRDHCPD